MEHTPNTSTENVTVEDLRERLSEVVDELENGRRYVITRDGRRVGVIVPTGPVMNEEELEAGYLAMAADEEREAEAMEWCEALIGDVADEAR